MKTLLKKNKKYFKNSVITHFIIIYIVILNKNKK